MIRRSAEQWARETGLDFARDIPWPAEQEFLAELDRSVADLVLVNDIGPPARHGVILYSVIRNERLRLPGFLRHHREIGVRHFVIVDNASTDGSHEYLRQQPDVELYRTEASFNQSAFGGTWTGGLIRRRDLGRWILRVDADEWFVFDGMNERTIDDLTDWLARAELTRAYAPLIDLYPDDPPAPLLEDEADLLAVAPFFDPVRVGLRRSYRREPRGSNIALAGGPRERRMLRYLRSEYAPTRRAEQSGFCLDNTPLMKWSERSCYPVAHHPWPRLVHNRTQVAALLHFKLLPDLAEKTAENLAACQHWRDGVEYRAYRRFLERASVARFKNRRSRRYTGPRDLIEANLLQPIDWSSDPTSQPKLRPDRGPVSGVIDRVIDRVLEPIHGALVDACLMTQFRLDSPWPAEKARPDQDELDQAAALRFIERSERSLPQLSLVKPGPPSAADSPDLYSVVYNEALRLPLFLEHYRKLGIRRFVFVDNASTDGTGAYLRSQQDVELYESAHSYGSAGFGQCWVQGLVRRDGLDRWVLYVDADELLVFDGMETRSLGVLTRWLEASGHDRLDSMMVDLYPAALEHTEGRGALRSMHFDPWRYRMRRFYARRPERRGVALFGGPRARIFRWTHSGFRRRPAVTYLNKTPLMKWTDETAWEMIHFPYPYRSVRPVIYGSLLHLKFLADFERRARESVARQEHWGGAQEHHSFLEATSKSEKFQLVEGWSRPYRGPQSLIDGGLLAPIDWEEA